MGCGMLIEGFALPPPSPPELIASLLRIEGCFASLSLLLLLLLLLLPDVFW
jgi:hypothetical protein